MSAERKQNYFSKLQGLLDKYPKILVVGCDNVGSNHMQRIRSVMRGEAVLLMGKKTMMRKAIRMHLDKNPRLESLLPHIHGNVGFVFTDKDLAKIRDQLTELKVNAPAKAGTFAPNDVVVPAGNTGLEPTQTSFLQALNIASKINKGQVEIMQDVALLKKGDKVGASEATLLSKLNIKPFLYGLVPRVVYEDGFVFETRVLDMTDDDVFGRFAKGVQAVAALSLAVGVPTTASVPHSIGRGFRNLISIAVATAYSFKQADKIKAILADPKAAAAAMAAAAAAAAPAAPAAAKGGKGGDDKKKEEEEKKKKEAEAKKKAEEEEKKKAEEEETADMGLDLFG